MNRRTSAWVATHAPAGTRWGTKTLSLLLSLVLCLTLLPGAAFAEGNGNTDTGKAIQLDTGSITGGQASSVYFGNVLIGLTQPSTKSCAEVRSIGHLI